MPEAATLSCARMKWFLKRRPPYSSSAAKMYILINKTATVRSYLSWSKIKREMFFMDPTLAWSADAADDADVFHGEKKPPVV